MAPLAAFTKSFLPPWLADTMEASGFEDKLVERLGRAHVRSNVPLASLTTLRVGGPADWLVEVNSTTELLDVLSIARSASVPLTVLGGGSNIVVADAGVRGVVVRPRLMSIDLRSENTVRADAGVTVNGLVRWTVGRGLAGLERWAGTPGTVGGAVHGNAHWSGVDIGGLVRNVLVAGRDGETTVLRAGEMEFAYDSSRLKRTGEVLLWAEFGVGPGNPDELRGRARASLAFRKHTQPLNMPSAGCVFQNPDPVRDSLPDGIPASAGALVDRAGLKGHRVGRARISETHANFVVNEGGATARDVRRLIETARAAVFDRFGVALRDEVVYLGTFDNG
jgi:UDP-N-acetylmuramate dehydrogenase